MTTLPLPTFRRCLDCGRCTSVCPVARYERRLSPRRMVRGLGRSEAQDFAEEIWSCLTCRQCDAACPQQVSITDVVPLLRRRAREAGQQPAPTRCSAMELITVMQSQATLDQDRLGWLPEDVDVDASSRTLLWVGCLPYFDAFFIETAPATTRSAIGAVRILNALGIRPAVRSDERCCGHDALTAGDDDTFERLAQMNLKMLAEVQPERIITVCPECAVTLLRSYPDRFGAPDCEVVHIAQIVAEQAERLGLTNLPLRVSLQDPCRLGRYTGEYEAPRNALRAVPGIELREMPRSRGRAICCAGSWLHCDQATKRIQLDRLAEARGTGSEVLITACPKCLVHFRCAQADGDPEKTLEIRDLAALIASALPKQAERG